MLRFNFEFNFSGLIVSIPGQPEAGVPGDGGGRPGSCPEHHDPPRDAAERAGGVGRTTWETRSNYTLRATTPLEVVSRPAGAKGFVLLPRRWVVERTFAWLKRCRRLSVDREKSTPSCEAMIRLAMIHLMLHRLRPDETDAEFRYREAA